MAMGADWCNSARGFMFALGCIQAQTCHTGNCPTGVATQDPVRQEALVVPDKAERVYRFHQNTLHALKELVQAAGLQHRARSPPAISCGAPATTKCACSAICCPSSRQALLREDLEVHSVFKTYWPAASADSFSPNLRRTTTPEPRGHPGTNS